MNFIKNRWILVKWRHYNLQNDHKSSFFALSTSLQLIFGLFFDKLCKFYDIIPKFIIFSTYWSFFQLIYHFFNPLIIFQPIDHFLTLRSIIHPKTDHPIDGGVLASINEITQCSSWPFGRIFISIACFHLTDLSRHHVNHQ